MLSLICHTIDHQSISTNSLTNFPAYIISSLQNFLNLTIHVVMIQSHEHRIYNNAKRDKQLNKWIKHQPGDPLLDF